MKPYLTRGAAAAYLTGLGLPGSSRSLSALASKGTGPKFIRIGGSIRYTKAALDAWIAAAAVGGGGEV